MENENRNGQAWASGEERNRRAKNINKKGRTWWCGLLDATHAVIGTLRPTERRRANLLSTSSGAEGDRTPDLCSAIAALSQLSYSPVTLQGDAHHFFRSHPGLKATAPPEAGPSDTVNCIPIRPKVNLFGDEFRPK